LTLNILREKRSGRVVVDPGRSYNKDIALRKFFENS